MCGVTVGELHDCIGRDVSLFQYRVARIQTNLDLSVTNMKERACF